MLIFLSLLFSGCVFANHAKFDRTVNASTFYKGNLHTHTSRSDGDAPPNEVYKWYRENGYNFLAITDHDKLTDPTKYKKAKASQSYVSLKGVELTGLAANKKPVHVNMICAHSGLKAPRDQKKTVAQILAEDLTLAKKDKAIALVNHPNFGWAIKKEDLLSVDDFDLLEIASGHPIVARDEDGIDQDGKEKGLAHEKLWDIYMTEKKRPIFGAAVDDAHEYKKKEKGPEKINPGRAWINVWFEDSAEKLGEKPICDSIKAGRFYSARGAVLTSIMVAGNTLDLNVQGFDPKTDFIEFIGANSEVLAKTTENPARYTLNGDELYVRARITQSGGRSAWTQAYFVTTE